MTDALAGFLTGRDIARPVRLSRPDYIGVVSGAQYKLEAADEGITEYALVVVEGGEARLFEMSVEDLRYLGKQITGLVGG